MFQSKKQRLQVITWFVVLYMLTVFVYIYGGDADDAYWHIKMGEWTLTHWQVPSTGIYSYSNADKPWVSHEWLSAVLMYKVFQYAGWAGLVFLALVSEFVSLMLLFSFLLKRLSTVQSIIIVLFAFFLLLPHFVPRPHIFVIPITLYWTKRLIDASEKQTEPPFYSLPIMILWANMHGSFVIGIAFSLFFAVEAVFYSVPEARKQLSSRWILFIIATVLCAAITPHGINGLLLPFQLSNQNYALDRVTEWLSPDFHHFQPLELWLLSFLFLVLLLGIKLPVLRLIFLLGLLHLSLKHSRYASDLLSVLFPLILATPLANQLHSRPDMSFREFLPKTYKGILIPVIYFCGMFFFLEQIKVVESKQNQQIQKVLQVLKPEQQRLGNVLNLYEYGDFLIFLDYQTFIDPRAELYGDKFIKEYVEGIGLVESSKKLEDMIAKYHITWTLMSTSKPVNTYLATQVQWRKLYSDKVITLFVHQSVKLPEQTLINLKTIEKQALEEQKKDLETNELPE